MAYAYDYTVRPSGGNYSNYADAETAISGLTPSGDGIRLRHQGAVTCTSTWAGLQSGWSSSCILKIEAESGNTFADRSSWTGADGSGNDPVGTGTIQITEASEDFYFGFSDLEIAGVLFVYPNSSTTIVGHIWNCMFRDGGSKSIWPGNYGSGDVTLYVGNILFRDNTSGANAFLYTTYASATIYAHQCTFDCNNTVWWALSGSTGSLEIRNSVGIDTAYTIYNFSGIDEDYCAADDSSPSGAHSIDDIVVANNFKDASGEDYRPETGGDIVGSGSGSAPSWFTDRVGAGANGTGKDIVGNDYASTQSMGCFAYVSGGAPTTFPHYYYAQQ